MKDLTCNRKDCNNQEILTWPEPYKPGDIPVRLLDGGIHECDTIQRYHCSCGNLIHQFKGERGICSVCQLKRFEF